MLLKATYKKIRRMLEELYKRKVIHIIVDCIQDNGYSVLVNKGFKEVSLNHFF